MNVFSEDDFLNAFIKTYFPEQEVTIELFELEGKVWRLPSSTSGEPINKLFELVDFFEPLDTNSIGTQFSGKKVDYLPRVSQKIVSHSEWVKQDFNPNFYVAPTIFWSFFGSWKDFTNYVQQRQPKLFSDSYRRQRKLERELGPIQFTSNDRRPEVLEIFFHWKQEQLQRQNLPDRFTNSERISFFKELSDKGLLLTSSLSTEKHLLATCVGLLHRERFYFWNTAYNPTFSQYSPGRLLLHFLLEQSFKLQQKEFNLLWGDQDYKLYYATHIRLIEDIGRRPFSRRLRHFLKGILNQSPSIQMAIREYYNKTTRLFYR
jgi:hypothetical protein